MQKLFNKILVPVDFSGQSTIAVEKAIELAGAYKCSIHLLHVESIHAYFAFSTRVNAEDLPMNRSSGSELFKSKMIRLCDDIRSKVPPGIQVNYSVVPGSWNESIIELTDRYHFDLILIGEYKGLLKKRKMQLNPNKLAIQTNVPVISVPSKRRLTKLYSIVIPVTDFLPVRKLMYGVYIASGFDTTLKLLGIETEQTAEKVKHYMQQAVQLINDNCDVKVEKETTRSPDVAIAVKAFAKQQAADLVIVNPGTQTNINGLFNSLLSGLLQQHESPPVLTVSPA